MIKKIEDIKGMPQPLKATFGFMVASFFSQGIHFITTPIFTRILTEADYGIISVYNSWQLLFVVFITLNLAAGVYNNAILDYKENIIEFTSVMLFLISLISILYGFILLLFKDAIVSFMGLPISLLLFMLFSTMVNSAFSFWMLRQRFKYKYKMPVFITILSTLLTTGIGMVAVLYAPYDKVFSKVVIGGLPSAAIGLFFYIRTISTGRKLIDFKYLKYALSFNIPLVPHYLSFVVLAQSDRIMIAKMSGEEYAGMYNIAYMCGTAISIVIGAINSSWVPFTFKNLKENKYVTIEKYTNYLIIFMSAICIFAVVLAPEILKILAPPSYYEAVWVIPLVIMATYFTFLCSLFANVEFYHKKNIPIMIASVSAAIINIVLNLIFIPIYGYVAAAYTTLIGYIVLSIAHYFFMRKAEKNKVYNMRIVVLSSFVVICGSFLLMTTYNIMFVRYGLILLIVIFAFLFKKRVKSVFIGLKNN